MDILKFILRILLKTLMFAISLSFTIIKFVVVIVLMIFTLGAFGSSTSKY